MPNILLVDSDESSRNVLSEILLRAGYDVDVAKDGREAIKLCNMRRPDLVVTELVLPEKDGLELIGELHRSHPDIQIVAMTEAGRMNALPLLRAAGMLGAHGILVKPFSSDDLVKAIVQLLGS